MNHILISLPFFKCPKLLLPNAKYFHLVLTQHNFSTYFGEGLGGLSSGVVSGALT